MTIISAPDAATSSTSRSGPLGRLGTWVIDHRRVVTAVWLLVIIGLGAFAPGVERSLSGAGWQADRSESVAVRKLVQQHFDGRGSYAIQVVVHSDGPPLTEGDGPQVIARVSQIQLLQIFFTIGISALFFGEQVEPITWLFAGGVIVTVVLGRKTAVKPARIATA